MMISESRKINDQVVCNGGFKGNFHPLAIYDIG
jgi:hypothetical protein